MEPPHSTTRNVLALRGVSRRDGDCIFLRLFLRSMQHRRYRKASRLASSHLSSRRISLAAPIALPGCIQAAVRLSELSGGPARDQSNIVSHLLLTIPEDRIPEPEPVDSRGFFLLPRWTNRAGYKQSEWL